MKIFKLLIGVLLLSVISCKSDDNNANQPKSQRKPLVKIEEVTSSKIVSSIDITGTVQANIVTEVKSPADGFIESLLARENQYVEKNKLIAIINPTDRVSLISSNFEKVESLERTLKSTDKSSVGYQELLSEIEKAKSDLTYAQNMYKTIPVVCPMNGLVTQRWLDKGSQVTAKDIIITITDMGSLVIKAEVNERYFEAVKQGKKLPLILNAYPNDTLTGVISLIYPQVDPVTRSVKFDIKIQNFKKSLLPGMMASIKIPVSVIENALTVPEYAVLTSPDNKNFLFVVNKDTIAIKRMVQTGISTANKLEIKKGLNENEKVVVSGQEMLKDSVKVMIMK